MSIIAWFVRIWVNLLQGGWSLGLLDAKNLPHIIVLIRVLTELFLDNFNRFLEILLGFFIIIELNLEFAQIIIHITDSDRVFPELLAGYFQTLYIVP